jgi:hypothetical protein
MSHSTGDTYFDTYSSLRAWTHLTSVYRRAYRDPRRLSRRPRRLRPDARRDRTSTPTRTLRLDPTLAIRGLITTYKHIFYELRLNRESILSRSS